MKVGGLFAVTVVAAGLVAAPTALGATATASIDPSPPGNWGVVSYAGTGTEANDVQIATLESGNRLVRATDPGAAGIQGSNGCTSGSRQSTCAINAPVDAALGRVITADTAFRFVKTDLGAGNDRVRVVGPFMVDLAGGPGNDVLDGSGAFRLTAKGEPGADTYIGGSDPNNKVDYSGYQAGIDVTLDGLANDGSAGEADTVEPSIQYVSGTQFSDRFVGSDERDEFDGNGGGDTAYGLGGNDSIFVGKFADGGAGDDFLGGETDARLVGGDGADRIADYWPGASVDGGADNDFIEVGDSSPGHVVGQATVTCGDGYDVVWADPTDVMSSDCEEVHIQ
jgi:Ca2+-binding RTX toxin-like protein